MSFLTSATFSISHAKYNRPVGRAVALSSLEREVGGSNLGPVKSNTELPTVRHRCDISSKEAVLPGRNADEMGLANSTRWASRTLKLRDASAYYRKYNERFDLTCKITSKYF